MKYLVDANVLSEPTKPTPDLACLRTTGKAMPIKDSLIAATAVVHGLAVATRNRVDFVNAGVPIVDPFVD